MIDFAYGTVWLFVQPLGSGWYRYHTLFAQMLRLKLRFEHPERVTILHQRAARWYQRDGRLADAVRHAAQAGDWPLAAGMVVDELAIALLAEGREGDRREHAVRFHAGGSDHGAAGGSLQSSRRHHAADQTGGLARGHVGRSLVG